MRDQYSVELGKHPVPRSGDAAEDAPTSKWPYFMQLHFLRDIVKPRVMSGNLSGTQSTQETCREETQSSVREETQSSVECDENSVNDESIETSEREQERAAENVITSPSTSRKTTSIPTPATAKKRRGNNDTYQASMLEIERRKVEYLENKAKKNSSTDQEDEHLSFFKSLLPHVRKIPEHRILSFRCRVQELVDQFSYQLNIVSTPSSSISTHCGAPSPDYNRIDQNVHNSVPSSQQSIIFQGHLDNTIPPWT